MICPWVREGGGPKEFGGGRYSLSASISISGNGPSVTAFPPFIVWTVLSGQFLKIPAETKDPVALVLIIKGQPSGISPKRRNVLVESVPSTGAKGGSRQTLRVADI